MARSAICYRVLELATMSHFYLTLPSNASMKYHENNTAAKYTTQLPNALDLNGDWEVALSEIIYPCKFDLVSGDACKIEVYVDGFYVRQYNFEKSKYDVPATLIRDLNIISNRNYYLVSYEEATRQVTVKVHEAKVQLIFSDALAHALGFKNKYFDGPGTYVGERITEEPSTMYVNCDLIEHVVVGDSRVPLLRTFGMEKSLNEVVHRTFQNPLYVPVQKKHFDSIEMNIMTDAGEAMPFASGKSVAILHFRRSSNPYFLLQR